ncbi:diguanylate cyclase [Hydrogenimonas sp.]
MFPTVRNAVDAQIITEIMSATRVGIVGQLLVLLFCWVFFYAFVPAAILYPWMLLHGANMLYRIRLVERYREAVASEADTETLDAIFRRYLVSLGATSLLWAAMPLLAYYLPEEYHFLAYALVISLTYGSTMAIGPLTPIFLMYVLPMNLSMMGILLYEGGTVHTAAALFLPVALFFAGRAAKMHLIDYTSLIAQKTHVTELKDYFEYHASHDALTGLANRQYFMEHLEETLRRCGEKREPVALFFLDLDRFKEVNDTYGHAVGDRVLQIAARRLRAAVRSEDFVARFAGDEFVVVMEGVGDEEALERVAFQIRDAMGETMRVGDASLRIVPSIGIALFPLHARGARELVAAADEAMYRSKRKGSICAVARQPLLTAS